MASVAHITSKEPPVGRAVNCEPAAVSRKQRWVKAPGGVGTPRVLGRQLPPPPQGASSQQLVVKKV